MIIWNSVSYLLSYEYLFNKNWMRKPDYYKRVEASLPGFAVPIITQS